MIHCAILNDLGGLNQDRKAARPAYVEATRATSEAATGARAAYVPVSAEWVVDGTQAGADESTLDSGPDSRSMYGFPIPYNITLTRPCTSELLGSDPKPIRLLLERFRLRVLHRIVTAARVLIVLVLVTGACAPSPPESTDPFDSVAQLRGEVCGRPMVGTAVVIGSRLLITAAHNVAGSRRGLTVTFEDGVGHAATLVGIDVDRDLALLSVPTADRPAIVRAAALPGEQGRIIRLRGQGERAEVPFTDAEPVIAVGPNMYDEESSVRRANVRVRAMAGAGYSGGPILNSDDEMAGLVYAAAWFEDMTYANATGEIEVFLASVDPTTQVDSGRCPG